MHNLLRSTLLAIKPTRHLLTPNLASNGILVVRNLADMHPNAICSAKDPNDTAAAMQHLVP